MSEFINTNLLQFNRINTVKNGCHVDYIIYNIFVDEPQCTNCNKIIRKICLNICTRCKNNAKKCELCLNCVYSEKMWKGRIDCIDYKNNVVYEFKMTTKIKIEHILQLALYAYNVLKKCIEQCEKEKDCMDSKFEDCYKKCRISMMRVD